MSQSVVNFLTASGPPSSPTLVTDPRVFNFEIDQSAQLYYTQAMLELQSDLSNPPTANTVQDISNILNSLNNWSGMISVQNNVPVINPVTQVITGYTTAQTYVINGNVEPVTSNGVVFPVNFNGNGAIILNSSGAATANTTIVVPQFAVNSTLQLTSTMNQYMAQDLDQIIRTFRSAGWDPTENPYGSSFFNATTALNSITTIQQNPAVYGLLNYTNPTTGANNAGLIFQALTAVGSADVSGQESVTQSNNIQQLLMVGYIATGNQILSNQLSQLQNAINTNQSVLAYLNSLQDLMNQKSPQQFILQLQNLNNLGSQDPATQLSNVNNFENQSYNQAINVVSNINGSSPAAIQQYLAISANASLQTNLTLQSNITSTNVSDVLSALGSFVPNGSTSIDANQAINALNQYIVTTLTNINEALPAGSTNTTIAFSDLQALGFGTIEALPSPDPTIFVYNTDPNNMLVALQNLLNKANLTPAEQSYFSSASPTSIPANALPANWSNPPTVLQYAAYQLSSNFANAPTQEYIYSNGHGPHAPPPTIYYGVTSANDLTSLAQGFYLSNTMNSLLAILPVTSTLISQGAALQDLAQSLVTAINRFPSNPLLTANSTNIQASLSYSVSFISSFSAPALSEIQYLNGIVPALTQNITDNNELLTTVTGGLAADTFTSLASSMSTVFTYSKAQIIANLQYLSSQIVSQGGPAGGPLSTSINQILQDFQSANSINSWIEDGGDSGTSALSTQGNYQNDLTNAQTAAQSFNQTQQETLSEVMFTFEEFYKSASGMLSTLDQMLEKMADAISRS